MVMTTQTKLTPEQKSAQLLAAFIARRCRFGPETGCMAQGVLTLYESAAWRLGVPTVKPEELWRALRARGAKRSRHAGWLEGVELVPRAPVDLLSPEAFDARSQEAPEAPPVPSTGRLTGALAYPYERPTGEP